MPRGRWAAVSQKHPSPRCPGISRDTPFFPLPTTHACSSAASAPPRLRRATPRPNAWPRSSAPTGMRGSTRARTSSRAPSCSATTASRRAASRSTRSTRSSRSIPTRSTGASSPTRRRSPPRPRARAGRGAGSRPAQIDAVVVSTCTGYLCPGLSGYVVERLGLRADVQAYDLVGQGCAAALPNLQLGRSLLGSGAAEHVLSVCVEVSSAAMYLDDDPGRADQRLPVRRRRRRGGAVARCRRPVRAASSGRTAPR